METYRMIMRRLGNAAFYIYSSIGKYGIRRSRDPRPSSDPYISGDGFRNLGDHILDETHATLELSKIRKNDKIFVSGPFIKLFFGQYHKFIRVPYVLITHNGDECVDGSYKKFLSKYLVKWYAQNVTVAHPKIIPIPIGLENLNHYNHGIPWIYKKMNRNKHMRILYGFTKGTNKNEREQALKSLKKSPMAVSLSGYHHSAQYAKILSSYAFVASPSGNGLDCHRSWEALYCGVIPIVKRSVAMEYFVSLGLPIYCVDTWKELEVLSEEKLHMIYNSRRSTFRSPSLYLSYWRKRIGKHI